MTRQKKASQDEIAYQKFESTDMDTLYNSYYDHHTGLFGEEGRLTRREVEAEINETGYVRSGTHEYRLK